jgi:hypothetical protein
MNKYEEALNNIHKHGKTMTWDDAGAIIEALNCKINKTINDELLDQMRDIGIYYFALKDNDNKTHEYQWMDDEFVEIPEIEGENNE